MTPHEVAADRSLRLRFQEEVAYLDRMRPTDAEAGADSKLFESKDGVLVVAWLWPSLSYEGGFDPLDAVSEDSQLLSEYAAEQSQELSPTEALEAMSVAFDLRRRSQLGVVATRFRQLIASTAQAVDRSEEDVMGHLSWSVPLSRLELARLLVTHAPFPFQVIVKLCRALQLEFEDAWFLVDPPRLASSIDRSLVANRILDQLRSLPTDDLEAVDRRLPRRAAPEQAEEPETYRAPRLGGRYSSLYEALASDPREAPDYTIAELDRILVDAGEAPLPDSARNDRSWWAGSGTKTEGHPQLSAWWAAGYRIRELTIDPSSDQVASVRFESLPGRSEWLANRTRSQPTGRGAGRTGHREYRVPGPQRIEIYRSEDDLELRGFDETFTAAWFTAIAPDMGTIATTAMKSISAALQSVLETTAASTPLTSELFADIAGKLTLEAPTTGTEDALSLESLVQLSNALPVAEMARSIIKSNGGTWEPEFTSEGNYLTTSGVQALIDATGMDFDALGVHVELQLPDDPDIRQLVEFLNESGEADRSEIERHFNESRQEPVDSTWMTNLLTRARRQGWTVNNGTRSRPRWVAGRPNDQERSRGSS